MARQKGFRKRTVSASLPALPAGRRSAAHLYIWDFCQKRNIIIKKGKKNLPASFFFEFERAFCACSTCSNLHSAKEKPKIVSMRGGAWRGNAIRVISKIHRQKNVVSSGPIALGKRA